MARFRVLIGNEWTRFSLENWTSRIEVNEQPIQRLKPIDENWFNIEANGHIGIWCNADYEIPCGAKVKFIATYGAKTLEREFTVNDDDFIDLEGYHNCGWMVSI